MNKEELKNMIKTCVYSEDGITYMSDKQYNNYIDTIDKLQQENKQLQQELNKNNKIIEEIKEYLCELRLTDVAGKTIVYRLLNKIEELEKGDK